MNANKYTRGIKTLFSRMQIATDNQQIMVETFTDGRTSHVSKMSNEEGAELFSHLRALDDNAQSVKNLKRRKLISLFREMGCNRYDEDKGRMVADMPLIEQHLVRFWGKLINEYSSDELSKIIAVTENQLLPWYYKNKNLTLSLGA